MGDLNFLCLCPTYGRPKLLANAVALFEAQDYPTERRKLLILDDANQYSSPQGTNSWSLISVPQRYASMPLKYKAMWEHTGLLTSGQWDAIAVWDDDDIYLPNHLRAHAEILESGFEWSHPARVYCAYDPITVESVGGGMWASLAARVSLIQRIEWDKWFATREADFDQKFMRTLNRYATAGRGGSLSFMFRWGATNAPHLQWFIKSPNDTDYYAQFPRHETNFVERPQPKLNSYTVGILDLYSRDLLPKGPQATGSCAPPQLSLDAVEEPPVGKRE